MPFTVSHAAVAAPLARRGLICSALVVGSMAPDFEFFLRLGLVSRWGHTLYGVVYFTLPAALAVLWLFHRVLKRPLLALLPPFHRDLLTPHAGPFAFGPPRRFARVVVSLLAGILSHLMLDAFTHEHGAVVARLPLLQAPLLATPWCVLPAYEALQYASSVALSLVLLVQYGRWCRRVAGPAAHPLACLDFRPMLPLVLPLGAAAAAVALAYGVASVPPVTDLHALRLLGGRVIAAGLTLLAAEFALFSLFAQRWRPRASAAIAQRKPGDHPCGSN